jgi:hypothetical protein
MIESLERALVDHIAAFGGIPLVAVFDRPKTVALQWGRAGVVTEWNPTLPQPATRASAQIVIVQNWFEELRRLVPAR